MADLSSAVVRILKPDHRAAGTGFVVSGNGLIATCAHVVQNAGVEPGDAVDLIFHATGERRVAKVVPEYWRDSNTQDVAVLHLEGSLPNDSYPVLLGSSDRANGHDFSTYGFPLHYEVGMWGSGTIGNLVHYQTAGSMLQLSATKEVTTGFSAVPVLDIDTDRVVGMGSGITAPDQFSRLAETAFATPTRTPFIASYDRPVWDAAVRHLGARGARAGELPRRECTMRQVASSRGRGPSGAEATACRSCPVRSYDPGPWPSFLAPNRGEGP
jgi:hypothetical protein